MEGMHLIQGKAAFSCEGHEMTIQVVMKNVGNVSKIPS
jgi:hypothetical protein